MNGGVKERFRDELLGWSRGNLRSFAWRREDIPLYEMFISEFFLARTRSGVVADVMDEFFEEFPDLEALETASKEEIAEVIRPMGLQNMRAKALVEIAETVDGDIPADLDELLELPRVGPYVANATLCFGLDRQLPIVDRNVDRVYRRVFGEHWSEMTETEQWAFAREMLPEDETRRYNYALLDFPSIICTPQDPACSDCFAREYCHYYAENVASE